LRAEGHHVISLGQALPFFPPPAPVLDAAREALDRPEVHRYSTDPGLPGLRAALAERLSHDTGNAVSKEDLIITAGGNHAFTLALMTLVSPGDEVVLPSPYFTNHHMAIVALGATPIEAPVADRETFAVRWIDIEPHLTARTKAVVLCTPSNPTGAVIDASEGERIVARLSSRGIVVFSDETYSSFVFDGGPWSAASAPAWRDNVVVVSTFSKMFGMMGWRAGYVLADAGICTQAVKVQDAMIICAPVISQMAAEGGVRQAWTYARSFAGEFQERRRIVREGLSRIPRLRWTPTSGGLFAFTRVEDRVDSHILSEELLERAHVVTIPGAAFGTAGEGHIRLSYGYAGQDDLREALDRLRRFFS
jgi:aminotransferase